MEMTIKKRKQRQTERKIKELHPFVRLSIVFIIVNVVSVGSYFSKMKQPEWYVIPIFLYFLFLTVVYSEWGYAKARKKQNHQNKTKLLRLKSHLLEKKLTKSDDHIRIITEEHLDGDVQVGIFYKLEKIFVLIRKENQTQPKLSFVHTEMKKQFPNEMHEMEKQILQLWK